MLRFLNSFVFINYLFNIVKKIFDLVSLNFVNNYSKNWICIRGIILDFILNVSIYFLKKCLKNGIFGN